MRVHREEVDGYRTCGRPRVLDEAYWPDSVAEQDCPGYASEPVRVVREETTFTYEDNGATDTQSRMLMDVTRVERSAVRFVPVDGDWSCPHCGFEMCNFAAEPRPTYRNWSGQDPDELRRLSIASAGREQAQVDAASRSAEALQRIAEQGDQADAVAALRAEVAALREQAGAAPKARPARSAS